MTATPSWRDVIAVHPAANVFPRMKSEELQELADDIRQNGLKVPVVVWMDVDGKAWLLDGRNRLDAMELAGLPTTEADHLNPTLISNGRALGMVDGGEAVVQVDPAAYVISTNIQRRHLTPKQRVELADSALRATENRARVQKQAEEITGKPFPVSPKGGRGKKGAVARVAELAQVSKPTARAHMANPPRAKKPNRIPSTSKSEKEIAITKEISTEATPAQKAKGSDLSPAVRDLVAAIGNIDMTALSETDWAIMPQVEDFVVELYVFHPRAHDAGHCPECGRRRFAVASSGGAQ